MVGLARTQPAPVHVPAAPAPVPPRLRVLPDDRAQDCSTCRNMTQCWREGVETKARIGNLLVCRIQRDINRNASTKLFLELIRPKLAKIARRLARYLASPVRDVIAELESVAIECLLTKYVVGEQTPPMVFLFHPRVGAVTTWVMKTASANAQRRARHLSFDETGGASVGRARARGTPSHWWSAGAGGPDVEERLVRLNYAVTGGRITSGPNIIQPIEIEDPDVGERVKRALGVVDDGRTLSVAEYRVLKFCLLNAQGARVPDRVHKHLASVLRVQRKDVSRLYGLAYRRLVDAVGMRHEYLAARGLSVPTPQRKRLTDVEIARALTALASSRATVMDLAWALGVTDATVASFRRRKKQQLS